MEIRCPDISKLIGFNCSNKLEPFYTLNEINFIICWDKKNRKLFSIGKNFTSDGCTLKYKIIRFIFGCPHTPEYLRGSIIHDYFCKNRHLIDRKSASTAMRDLFIIDGVPVYKAYLMYIGVEIFQKFWRHWE